MAVGVNIVSQFDSKGITKAIKDFQKLESTGDKSAYALRTFDKAVTNGLVNLVKFGAAAGVAAGVIGGKLVQAASSLEESQSKVNAVFGTSASTISDFARTTATSMGITRQATLEAAGTFGNLIQAFGISTADAASMSTNLVTLAADLASFNNVPIDDVFTALRSGLSGETEPLKRFGVALNDARLKQEAMNMGLYDGKGALDITAKTQAAYALILKDTALAQGDVERTAGGFANQMRFLKAGLSDAAAELGNVLLPYAKQFVTMLNERLVPYLQRLAEVIGEDGIGGGIKMLADDFLKMTTNMGTTGNAILGVVTAITALKVATLAYSAASGIATIATAAFGITLNATGIGLIAAAIAAVVVGLVALYVKFEVVRKVVNAVGKAIMWAFREAAEKVINVFIGHINLVIKALNAMIWVANKLGASIEPIGEIGQVSFGELGDAAEAAAKKMAAAQKVAGRPFEQLVGDYRGAMPTIIKSGKDTEDTFSGTGKAVETAKEKLKKYIDALKGVTSAQRAARDATKAVTEANTKLATANERLTLAQANFQQVIRGFGAGSKEAKTQQQRLAEAQRRVERSGYGVEQAVFAVARAEAELAEIRLDPEASATAIRQAEIALAEAKLSVAEATDSQREATQELSDAERRLDEVINGAKEGSDAYKEALDALNEAKREQVDATDAVVAALEREKDAIDNVREAEEKLREVRNQTPAGIQARGDAQVNGTPSGGTGMFPSFIEAVRNLHPNSRSLKSSTPVKDAKAQFPKLYETYKAAGLALADGGIVTSPTTALIGEAGPEAVVPLDNLQSGMNITINITAGMGTDPAALGDEIVNVLQRYNRRNGALPLKVA